MTDLVTEMRRYAHDNYYTDSWDLLVSWSDAQVRAAIAGAKTRRGAIAKAWKHIRQLNERRPASHKPRRPVSLFQYLAKHGGLRPDAELQVIFDGNPFIGGIGPLVRQNGLDLDRAREAAVEAGYLYETPWDGGVAVSTIRDLLDALDQEARGRKVYVINDAVDDSENYDDPNLEESYDEIPF